jgi:hypothetical protein
VLPAFAGQIRATPVSPFRPILDQYICSTAQLKESILTTSHLRALYALDGAVTCFAIHVHADTDTIALVLAIDEQGGEPGMSLHGTQKGQGGESGLRSSSMHRCKEIY